MKPLNQTPDNISQNTTSDEEGLDLPGRRQDYDETLADVTHKLAAKNSGKLSKLKKQSGKMAAGALIATSLLLSACGGQDCTTVRQAGAPGSSTFTNPSTAPTQTYCTNETSGRSYGRGFYYIGGGSFFSGGGGSSSS